MPLTPPTSPTGAQPPLRGRGDACPGALRLHAADDGALARVRLPAGLLTARQAEVLARAAEELGDGRLDITSRGNVQLRGLGSDCGGALAERLRAAGLLPSDRHERARNIVASPLAGVDGAGHGDVRAWARTLDELLCAESDTTELSGRFLFAVDDGRGDVAALGADVTLIAAPDGQAVLRVGSPPSGTASRTPDRSGGSGAARGPDGGSVAGPPTTPPGGSVASGPGPAGEAGRVVELCIAAGDAPRAAVLAATEFLALVRESGSRAWRVAELPAGHRLSAPRLLARLARAGVPARERTDPRAADGPAAPPSHAGHPEPRLGLIGGPDGPGALSVLAPLGRLTAAQWRLLAGIAARDGAGELRVTPWRGVVLPGVPGHTGQPHLAALAGAGLVVDRGSPWYGVGACTGRTGCAKSLRDVRADAARAARRAGPAALPVYWSGCERRCGRPGTGDWVDVLATGEGYRVSVRGASGSEHTATAVSAEEAAGAVAAARATT
ncbi:nitrite reductase [Streptomyces sp. NPDC018031]|uniref:nitrite reductase n=1 Tax=Streptomyces sp. NPDC018031 TaxID=3365033 RepID=UPI00379FF232